MHHKIHFEGLILFVFLLGVGTSVWAEDSVFQIPTIKVFAGEKKFESSDSGYSISEDELVRKQSTDPLEVLQEVPGVHVQHEDAFGLRPNIGLRGVHPHRSRKVTLMEDGVLVAPAPYSAPAAYYFPIMNRIVDIQVYKGLSSLNYGPNSIGGAVNFSTRPISDKLRTGVDLSYGAFESQKYSLYNSGKVGRWGWLIEGTRLESAGFKELPSGNDTGFERHDLLVKTQWELDSSGAHIMEFKWNYADEVSHETYLGLSADDFARSPSDRYAASDQDKMTWQYRQFQWRSLNQWTDQFFSSLAVYSHSFNRVWDKFNAFRSKASSQINGILDDPTGSNEQFYDILRGEADSSSQDEEIVYGKNARRYISRGVQWEGQLETANNELKFGVLYHYDRILRNHKFNYFNMSAGELVSTGVAEEDDPSGQNKDYSLATRFHITNEHRWGRLLLKTGVRHERVHSERKEHLTQEESERDDHLWIPGVGLSYRFHPNHIVFMGVYRGVTLPGPGQTDNINSEESVNYELGYRLKKPVYLEVVAFYSDYQNILGTCSFSAGCDATDIDVQFNGGKAKVSGLEWVLGWEAKLKSWTFPFRFSGTYTKAFFDTEFTSNNSEWGVGTVSKSDPFPYLPRLKWTVSLGAQRGRWSFDTLLFWQDRMWDQSVRDGRKEVASYATIALNAGYQFSETGRVFLKLENIMDKEYVVSYRPFGARPGRPRWFTTGLQYTF